MTDKLRAAVAAALEVLINGKNVRAGEGGTKHQPTMEDAAIEQLRAALAEQDVGGCLYLTVVYRDVQPGPECTELCRHPKVSAVSWSHAIDDRNAARAATPRREWQSLTKSEVTDLAMACAAHPRGFSDYEFAASIEAALKEKNHD